MDKLANILLVFAIAALGGVVYTEFTSPNNNKPNSQIVVVTSPKPAPTPTPSPVITPSPTPKITSERAIRAATKIYSYADDNAKASLRKDFSFGPDSQDATIRNMAKFFDASPDSLVQAEILATNYENNIKKQDETFYNAMKGYQETLKQDQQILDNLDRELKNNRGPQFIYTTPVTQNPSINLPLTTHCDSYSFNNSISCTTY